MFKVDAAAILDSELYLENSKHQTAGAFKLIAQSYEIIDSLSCPTQVLDVGCGTGNVTKFLAGFTNLTRITGIDPAGDMVRVANQYCTGKRMEFFEGNIMEPDSLPPNVRNGSCGLVVCFSVLHWISDQETALKNIFQCLKPGGFFVAMLLGKKTNFYTETYKMMCLDPEFHELNKIPNAVLEHDWKTEDPNTSYRLVLENVGFNVKRCEQTPITYCFNDAELEGLIQTTFGKTIDLLPEEKRSKARDFVHHRFHEVSSIPSEGYINIGDNKRLFVVCQKPE